MNQGYRVRAVGPASVVDQVNLFIEVSEREQEDRNARRSGFVPFGLWQECSRVQIVLEAGIPTDLSVTHGLQDRNGKPVIPNAFLPVYWTGDFELNAVEPWSRDLARFEALSLRGAKVKLVFWRDI